MSTAAPCTDGVAFIGCDAVMTSTGLPPMMFLVQSSAMPTAVPTISTASDGNWSSLSVTGRDGITPVADVQYGLVGLFATLSVLGTIILSTIVGNVFVVAAVVLERNLRNVANYLVASLAVADLMVAALVMPLAAVNEVSTRWFLGKELCDAWTSIDVLCCTASILHLVAISLDRYWAVTRLDYIHNRSARRILVMIGASWGVSVIISFPPLFFTSHRHYDPNDTGECLISQVRCIVSIIEGLFARTRTPNDLESLLVTVNRDSCFIQLSKFNDP
jgi:hypothetical protein